MIRRSNGGTEQKKRVYIELDPQIAREFKKRCVDYDKAMSDVLRPHVEEFLRENPPIVDRRPNID